jgi:hypothetical protein
MAWRGSLRLVALPVALTAVALAGCGGGDDEESGAIDVKGVEYAFDMPDQGKAGVVKFDISNAGGELHEFALGRLAPGKSIADVKAYLKSGQQGTPSWFQDVGGVPILSPGQRLDLTRRLAPANYVFLCFIPSPKGVPHVNLGMLKEFRLSGDSGRDLPEPDATITARKGTYSVPPLEAGEQTIELRNADTKEREFFLFRLKPGKSLADVGSFFESGEAKTTPPATFLGAMQTIPAGTSVFVDVDLKAGEKYTLADNAGPKPIIASFTPQ